jgi:hypothetical protein
VQRPALRAQRGPTRYPRWPLRAQSGIALIAWVRRSLNSSGASPFQGRGDASPDGYGRPSGPILPYLCDTVGSESFMSEFGCCSVSEPIGGKHDSHSSWIDGPSTGARFELRADRSPLEAIFRGHPSTGIHWSF